MQLHLSRTRGMMRPGCTRTPRAAAAVVRASAAKKPAAAAKGFGSSKAPAPGEGCACGSGRSYKQCCKPLHTGATAAPSLEETLRARFTAIVKKDVPYLMKTTSPHFVSFHYGAEPGVQAQRQLEDDLHNTVDHYVYSDFKLREVRPGDSPDNATAVIQYTLYDKRTPLIDGTGKPAKKVQIEEALFVREDSGWLFSEYRIAEVPEALAKAAEAQAADMAAAQQQQAAAAAGGSS